MQTYIRITGTTEPRFQPTGFAGPRPYGGWVALREEGTRREDHFQISQLEVVTVYPDRTEIRPWAQR